MLIVIVFISYYTKTTLMEKKSMTVDFYGIVDNKEVKDGVTSGRVFVPKSWIGKKVTVLLLEPINE